MKVADKALIGANENTGARLLIVVTGGENFRLKYFRLDFKLNWNQKSVLGEMIEKSS